MLLATAISLWKAQSRTQGHMLSLSSLLSSPLSLSLHIHTRVCIYHINEMSLWRCLYLCFYLTTRKLKKMLIMIIQTFTLSVWNIRVFWISGSALKHESDSYIMTMIMICFTKTLIICSLLLYMIHYINRS